MTATLVDRYLAALPTEQRVALARLRALLLAAIPDAEEAIKTRVPAIRYKGKTVVGFGAAREHVALYVMFGDALTALKDDFSRYEVSSRVVRFSPAEPLPAALVRKVVRHRLAEIEAQLAPAPGRRGGARVAARR